MRDGNYSGAPAEGGPAHVSSLPMRDGNTLTDGLEEEQVRVSSLPMRDGNFPPDHRLRGVRGRLKPSYEGWKQDLSPEERARALESQAFL